MPWNSQRLNVEEDTTRYDMRIFSFKTPDGKTGIVVANRSSESFTFNINTGTNESFVGHRYTPENGGENYLGSPVGAAIGHISPTLPPLSYEVWISTGNSNVPTFFLPPDLLNGSANANQSITLNWVNKSVEQEGLILEKATDGENFKVIAQLSPLDTSYTDQGLEQLSEYHYRLKAFKGSDTSHYSITAIIKTPLNSSLDNLSQNKPVSVDSYHKEFYAEYAVDGDKASDASRWVSANVAFPHWIEIDLEEEYQISALRFWSGWKGYNIAIKAFSFQYFKAGQWIDIINEASNTSSEYAKAFDEVAAQKVRLYATEGSDNYLRLYEIEVLGQELTSSCEQNDAVVISIFPNPSIQNTVEIVGIYNISKLCVRDLSGRIKDVRHENNKVDVSTLKPGIYIITINDNNHIKYIKK